MLNTPLRTRQCVVRLCSVPLRHCVLLPCPLPSLMSSLCVSLCVAQLRVSVPMPKPPAFAFSGPLLGIAYASDAVAATWTLPIGASEKFDAATSTSTQFYDWAPKASTAAPSASGPCWPRPGCHPCCLCV